MKLIRIAMVVAILTAGLAFASDDDAQQQAEMKAWVVQQVAHYQARGWNGMKTTWVSKGEWAYSKVTSVSADGPAARAGLQVGDVIAGLNGLRYGRTEDMKALKALYKGRAVGQRFTYNIKRKQGEEWVSRDVVLEMGEVPDEVVARWLGRSVMKKFGLSGPWTK